MKIDHPEAAQIPGLKDLWVQAFGDPMAFIDCFFRTAFSLQQCLCITDGAEIMAAAYWLDVSFSSNKAAYVYAVATAPEHRGKGLCRQLMDTIHSHLETQGYAGVILVPGDDGLRQMYGKMGYADFGGMDTLSVEADAVPIPLTILSAESFCALRREFLPAGGVVQEGKNISFLAQFYGFYRGEDCLFAAAKTKEGLFVPEFLGKREDMRRVLAALGIANGVFRTTGTDAFAMYHPLCLSENPGYFAYAFD